MPLSVRLWAWIAPPVHGVVALTKSGDRVHAYLGNEADHFFVGGVPDAWACSSVLAVVAAVLVWQWRAHRGPVMVAALTVGVGGGCTARPPGWAR